MAATGRRGGEPSRPGNVETLQYSASRGARVLQAWVFLMNERDDLPTPPAASRSLHPLIYRVIIGLCAWLVLSAWGFAGPGYAGLVLSVVSLFIAVVVVLSLVLWHISRWRAGAVDREQAPPRLADWLSRDFAAWSGNVKGSQAAVEVLLPIAAVAFGMSTFAVVS
jgi:hypothetical protein